jgi:hypothetical protein
MNGLPANIVNWCILYVCIMKNLTIEKAFKAYGEIHRIRPKRKPKPMTPAQRERQREMTRNAMRRLRATQRVQA